MTVFTVLPVPRGERLRPDPIVDGGKLHERLFPLLLTNNREEPLAAIKGYARMTDEQAEAILSKCIYEE